MSLICKLGFLARGRHVIIQKYSVKSVLVYPTSGNTRKVVEPLGQLRFYSTNDDNSPIRRQRIYDGILQNKIRLVKMFSLLSSGASLMCQPYLISKALTVGSGTGTITGIVVTFGFFAFVTPVLLHIITKRYVVHIDYDPSKDTYIATTYSLFAQKKQLEFTPDDVSLPTLSEIMTTCMIKGKPMFMDVKLFTDVGHYKRIMGFDKPMDFSLSADDVKTRK